MTNAISTAEVVSDLNNLIQLKYDAIAAYRAAIERLDGVIYKEKFTEFLADHENHLCGHPYGRWLFYLVARLQRLPIGWFVV